MNKVFNLGLPKTGTNSFTKALNILGYKCKHDPMIEVKQIYDNKELLFEEFIPNILTGNSYSGCLCPIWDYLTQVFPKAKYILSNRNKDKWIESCEFHFKKNGDRNIRILIFGNYVFNKDNFSKVYDDYNNQILNYFKDKNNFAEIFIDESDKWDKLCKLLDRYPRDIDFPHLNKKEIRNKA